MAKKDKIDSFEVIDGEVKPIQVGGQAPASDPVSREGQLCNLAVNLAEKQLIEGTASSQVIVHYLKLATRRTELEMELLERQVALTDAKVETINTAKASEEMYKSAIAAMKRYAPPN